jgi:hypothetical protein
MAFPNTPIQSVYNRYHERGMVGSISRVQNNNFYFDRATAAVDMAPGDGVYLDTTVASSTFGEWLLPADDTSANANLVTHIVSFEQGDLNTDITPAIGNTTSEIIYRAGTPIVKAFAEGALYVIAGEDVVRGQALQFNVTTKSYGAVQDASTAKVSIIALSDASQGGLLEIRMDRVSAA